MLRNYASSRKTGTVVSVGRMQRTVTVLFRHNFWDKRIRKSYPKETRYLVSDPRDSLREGDVIEFSSGAPKSRHVHHIVERIITPFGVPIDGRPAVMSPQERQAERENRWAAKYVRRESRRLGEEVDLASRVEIKPGEKLSQAEMIHRIHQGNERVGKVKALVEKRLALQAQSDS
jgi:ribosomal protein S17